MTAPPDANVEAPRSPEAIAADPPVQRADLLLDAPLPLAGLAAHLSAALQWSLARVAEALLHGGLWIGAQRFDPEAPVAADAHLPAGTGLRLYGFERPPALPTAPLTVVHDADAWLAVLKPPFWSVQATRASRRLDLEAAVQAGPGGPEARAVHRLDRETSGLLLFARSGAVAGQLHGVFRAHAVQKTYVARVAGRPKPDQFSVQGGMIRVAHPRHSRFALVAEGGQPSHSDFTVLGPHGAAETWVEARPTTGRTHQLRVHLAHRGHPIVADGIYGQGWLPGGPAHLQLFATGLDFEWAGAPVSLRAPTPPGCPSP